MTERILPLLAALAALPPAAHISAQADSVREARDTLDRWVETRQLISEEKSDWRVEESILNDTKRLLENEVDRLDQAIEDLEASATEADKERSQLNARKERLRKATSVVKDDVTKLEQRMRAALDRLPEPLLRKIQPLIRRIPENPEETDAGIGQRVQNLVGILSQTDKFNTSITQTSESRDVGDGKTVEVRTLYWGVAHAFYVDGTGQYAGIGIPGEDGWEWPRLEDAGPPMRALIDVYEGKGDIRFVEVPARIQTENP